MVKFIRRWRDISVAKKLYIVIGIMAILIAAELFSLLFAMNTLSAVRGFVTGEALWSKAQKDAILSLQKYARTKDQKYYAEFNHYLEVPLGDRIARIELQKPNPDLKEAARGFKQGRIHEEDVNGLIKLVLRFHDVYHLKKALAIWAEGDRLASELIAGGEELHQKISSGASQSEILLTLEKLDQLNETVTQVEDDFSYTLGEGSRWLERVLMITLFFAVLLVESTSLLLTISFSRNLSRSLNELNDAAAKVGRGDFAVKLPVRSRDEIGRLAEAINKMTEDLESNIGERRQAETANQLKSMFLANMSHEIRTPVGAIMGFSELLKEPSTSEEERQKYLSIIHRTCENLTKIINDILDLSKVEAGYLDIQISAISLNELLSEIKMMLEARWSEKAIRISFHAHGYIPDRVLTDALRLRQVLMNILGNAVKFTHKGEVNMYYRVLGDQLCFEIRDTGPGISPQQKERLFQTFTQLDSSTTRRYEGTGLGLVLSRRLARLMGGDVILKDSIVGQGCTFVVTVKYEPEIDPLEALALRAEKEQDSELKLRGKTVLLVDDTDDNRLLISTVLQRAGMRVTLATNGAEAVDLARDNSFDFVLMDIQMPVMDGYTATRVMRSMGYKKPVVALTAHAMKEDRVRCIEAGCDDYITKPIHFNHLVGMLVRLLK